MEQTKKNRGKLLLAAFLLLVAVGYGALCVYAEGYTGVFPGVTVLDVDVGGLSRSAVEQKLAKRLPAWLDEEQITIFADDQVLGRFFPSSLGAAVSIEETTREAYEVGRTGAAVVRGWKLLCHWCGRTQTITPCVTYDEKMLAYAVSRMAKKFDRLPQAATCTLEAEGLFAVKEIDGCRLNQTALLEQLTQWKLTEIDADWQILPATPLDLGAIAASYPTEAANPYYDTVAQAVAEGVVGVQLNVIAAANLLKETAPGERVKLPAVLLQPMYTAAELEEMLFRDCLSTATTWVSGTTERRGNVRLAGENCHGVVLNSGEIFDYNLVVGERTLERGFGAAASYVNGKTVDTVGGGICQVSSTIYLSALLANMEITERYAHRFYPGYIGLGLDATVSWGGPEFRFCNNTDYPIQLRVTYSKNSLTVKIYGTKTDDTYVKMTNKLLSTTPYNTIYKETEDLPWGETKQEQNGYIGREVITYRNIYSGDGTLLSTVEEAKTSYKSRDEIILVGIAGKPEETLAVEEIAPAP